VERREGGEDSGEEESVEKVGKESGGVEREVGRIGLKVHM